MTDDPAKLDKQIDKAAAALERLNTEAEAVVGGTGNSTDLVPITQSAEEARTALARQRAEATKIRERVVKQTKALQDLQKRKLQDMERQLKREMERMNRMLAPLQDQLERLEEAVWTVNLYLGRDEQIVRLAEGAAAPASTPVIVRQLVLAMDQECAVASEHGGIDSLNHEHFDDWLQEDWTHVEQVVPEEKAVVACVPRYNSDPKFYSDPNTTEKAMLGNEQTYFLIRNGKNLYRTWTKFEIGLRLVPASDEFTSFFKNQWRHYGADGEALDSEYLEPGTDKWLKAEKAASYHQRQFMRVALILEGLLHRTTVFHPLPNAGISFIEKHHHEEGRVRFVLDAERLLTSGETEPFDDWLARLSGQLRPGMRIVGNFSGQRWREKNDSDEHSLRYGHSRVRPNNAEHPTTGAIYRIEDREPNGDLLIRYKRTQETYDPQLWVETKPGWGYRGGYKIPKKRASAIIRPGDDFVIPLDLVTIEECEHYLGSRLERHNYTTMFPVLKAAITAKRAEEAVEAPFREMMVGVLMRVTAESEENVRAALPELVHWFKLANRIHRPLIHGTIDETVAQAAGLDPNDIELVLTDPATGSADESKPVRLIVDEYKRRLRDAKRDHSAEIISGLREMHRDALLIGRTRTGRYLVLTPEEDARNVFVRERQYTAKAELRDDKRWVLPGTRVMRWTILFKSERWTEWDLTATKADHLAGPEQEEFIEAALKKWEKERRQDSLGEVSAISVQRNGNEVAIWTLAYDWRWDMPEDDEPTGEPGPLTGKRVPEPAFRCVVYGWRRKGQSLQLYTHADHQDGWKRATDRHVRHGQEKPWSPSDYEKDRITIWDDGGESLARYDKLMRAYSKHQAEVGELESIVDKAIASIRDQWLQPRYDDAYRRFLEEYNDPDLCEGHLKANPKLLPKWKYAHHRLSMERLPAYQRALQALIEKGVMPWGMTVRETVELAQRDDRFNYVWHWSEKVEHKESGYSSSDPELPPEQRQTDLPGDLAELTYVEDFELVKPWPEPEPEPEDAEEEWLDEEDEDQPEYDVETTADEEGLPALEAGTNDAERNP